MQKAIITVLFSCLVSIMFAQKQNTCNHISPAFKNKYGRMETYIPDSNTSVKTIQLNFIVFQKNDGSGNYQNTKEDKAKMDSLLWWVNGFYSHNIPPSDPIEGVEYIKDTKIQFEVAGYYFLKNSYAQSKDDVAYFQKLADSIPETKRRLNVFFTEAYYQNNQGASVGGKAQPPTFRDIDQYLVLFRPYNDGRINFATTLTFAHELGHCLDLMHTYDGSETCNTSDDDYLWDVFGRASEKNCPHKSGFFLDPFKSPNDGLTNNLMGSTNVAFYLSPLQIGKMHRALSLLSIRKYVKDCPYNTTPIEVKGTERWDFNIRTYSDIVIGRNDTMIVTCTVNMADNARIQVKRGGCLIVDGGEITGRCDTWKGVEVSKTKNIFNRRKKLQSIIIEKNGGKIEKAQNKLVIIGKD